MWSSIQNKAKHSLNHRLSRGLPRSQLKHQETTNINTNTVCVEGETQVFLSRSMCSITSAGPAANAGTELGVDPCRKACATGGKERHLSTCHEQINIGSCDKMKHIQACQPCQPFQGSPEPLMLLRRTAQTIPGDQPPMADGRGIPLNAEYSK